MGYVDGDRDGDGDGDRDHDRDGGSVTEACVATALNTSTTKTFVWCIYTRFRFNFCRFLFL